MNHGSCSYDSEKKAQSSQWKLPGSLHLKKAQQSCSKIKTMLTVFFDWECVAHHEYTPPGQTIRSTVSTFFFNWEMQYDKNSYSYEQLLIGSFVTTTRLLTHPVSCRIFCLKHQVTQVTQPLYSPDLVPCVFWLFQKLKSPLKWKRFQTVDEI